MKVIINNVEYEGLPGETLMELAKRNKVNIPNLCHKEGFEGQGRCRLCMVEAKEGNRTKIEMCIRDRIHFGHSTGYSKQV